jgi:hypothetical protein
MASDGNLNFDTRINTRDLDKELAKVRQQISKSIPDNAFDNLKNAFESSIKEVKNFKAEMGAMSDDGIFRYDALNDAQKKYYDDMLAGVASIEKQFNAVESGITLADKATRRFRALLVSMGVGILITALTGLISKLWEVGKALAGIEDQSKRFSRTLRVELTKPIDYQKEQLKTVSSLTSAYQDMQIQQSEIFNSVSYGFYKQTSALKAMGAQAYETYKDIFDAAGISREEVIKLAQTEDGLKTTLEQTSTAENAFTDNVLKNNDAISANIINIKSWRDEYEQGYKNFEKGVKGTVAGFSFGGIFGDSLENDVKSLDALEDKLKGLMAKEKNLQAQRAGASGERKVQIQEQLNLIDNEKNATQELITQQQESMRSYLEAAQIATAAFGSAAEAFGQALGEGSGIDEAFKSFGRMMVQSAIQAYSGVADQLIAWGTLALLEPSIARNMGITGSGGQLVAQGLAMKITAGILKGMLHYADGGIVKGRKSAGDNIPILATAGEIVLNNAMTKNLAGKLENGAGGVNIIINNNTDSDVSAGQNENGDILVMIENKVLETMGSRKGQTIIKNAGIGA